jgi:CRP-like cAMP-binding protein
VKMPRISDLLNTHPLVGALPAAARDPLLRNTKETVRGQGTALYREGSRPTGIWLVSIGVVKVSAPQQHKILLGTNCWF